jgi:hypothetical protein
VPPTQTAVKSYPSGGMQFPAIAKAATFGRTQLVEHVDSEIAGLKMELAILQETRRCLTGRNGGDAGGGGGGEMKSPANGERATSRRGASGGGKASGTGGKTSGGAPSEEAVLEAIRAGIGNQSPALAAKLGTTSETILRRLAALTAKGLLVKTGERSKTVWSIPEPSTVLS